MTPLATARAELAAAEAAYREDPNPCTLDRVDLAHEAVYRALQAAEVRSTRVGARERKIQWFAHGDAAQAVFAEVDPSREPHLREIKRGARAGQWELTYWKGTGSWAR